MKVNPEYEYAINANKKGLMPAWQTLPVFFFVLFSIAITDLSACAMSALIAVQGHTLADFPQQGLASAYTEYNDPWDYFGFVMANSSASTNNDGYGVVAYGDNDSYLAANRMWHKRVLNSSDFGRVYYTGHYLDGGEPNPDAEMDVMDTAMDSIKTAEYQSTIVLCHARNASGSTFGNHPFWFQIGDVTYTFMHNGSSNAAKSFMINRINQMSPGWFTSHPSNYFGLTNPASWVDSEVLFHYIMCNIIAAGNDTLAGLNEALGGIAAYLDDSSRGIYNFILSDGTNLYAYRSTPLVGANSHYRLSYKYYAGQFYAVRTRVPSPGAIEIQPQELVVFSHEQAPIHYPNFHPFAAGFTAVNTYGPHPLTVQFTDTSFSGIHALTNWLWDFGDGGVSNMQNPAHTYLTPGAYNVSLTVTDQTNNTSTLFKPNYINAFERISAVELTSSAVMNFGGVPIDEQSEYRAVTFANTGTLNIDVSSVHFSSAPLHFQLLEPFLGVTIRPGETCSVFVSFAPLTSGAITDSLYIHNNSANEPVLKIQLCGSGLFARPKPPQNPLIELNGNDVLLSWDAVTENMHDQAITPDYYLVFNSETPFGEYQFTGSTPELHYTHSGQSQAGMFYHVIAYKNYGGEVLDIRAIGLKAGMPEAEVLRLLGER